MQVYKAVQDKKSGLSYCLDIAVCSFMLCWVFVHRHKVHFLIYLYFCAICHACKIKYQILQLGSFSLFSSYECHHVEATCKICIFNNDKEKYICSLNMVCCFGGFGGKGRFYMFDCMLDFIQASTKILFWRSFKPFTFSL